MINIPKKIKDRFSKTIPYYQQVLKTAKDRDVNESDTVSILNDIIGEVLGYDKYIEVTHELAIRNTYCDLAIKVENNAQFIIEAKAIGTDLKNNHIKQACDYGANHGIQWIILTNGITWHIYRIRFEQPIVYDLVTSFDFLDLNTKKDNDLELLFLLSKEGLNKNAREIYYNKVQSVNKYIISNLILNDNILQLLKRELRKITENITVNVDEIKEIIQEEILKRDMIESDKASAARNKLNKIYKKLENKQKTSLPLPTITSIQDLSEK
jgi:hypothetical protein